MKYREMKEGIFLERPNRFIAYVLINGEKTVCHVKNTGRCKELLLPGVKVLLEKAENEKRKTPYDLVAVYKGNRLINMDSAAPNKAAAEFLPKLFSDYTLRSEVKCGNSRFDFLAEKEKEKIWIEVKGVTLEENGVVKFPDAPTQRGEKHVLELIERVKLGDKAMVLFVIQMENVSCFMPNNDTHPAFGEALKKAKEAGVILAAYSCKVEPDEMIIDKEVPIKL